MPSEQSQSDDSRVERNKNIITYRTEVLGTNAPEVISRYVQIATESLIHYYSTEEYMTLSHREMADMRDKIIDVDSIVGYVSKRMKDIKD